MKGVKILATITLCILSATGSMAQTDSIKPNFIKAFGNRIDTKAHLKYDPNYIDVPEKPWRVILRGKTDENIVDFVNSNTIKYEGTDVNTRLSLKFDSELNKSIGVWIGYRGLGFGYYYKPNKKPDLNIAISATAAKIGFNLRLRSMQTSNLHFRMDQSDGDTTVTDEMDAVFTTHIDIISAYLNAYYVFNGERYSQGAAYNQVVVQRKSAGSLLLAKQAAGIPEG